MGKMKPPEVGFRRFCVGAFICQKPALGVFDLLFGSVAASFYDDGFDMVQDPVQQRCGECGVLVEDFRPLFVGTVGGQDG